MARREQARLTRGVTRVRAVPVSVTVEIERPVGDPPGVVERGGDLHHGRGAERLPRELLVAHPLHPHRLSGQRAGDERGVERDVVRAVVPVAAGALGVDHADITACGAEDLRDLPADRMDPLGVRPDRVSAVLELRERA